MLRVSTYNATSANLEDTLNISSISSLILSEAF